MKSEGASSVMKKNLIQFCVLICVSLLNSSYVVGAEVDAAWVKQQALQVATQYANSIACGTLIEEKNLIALRPWKNQDDDEERFNAEYALVWHGDVGCAGGSGSANPQIAIVRITTADFFSVDPLVSSPVIKFDVPVHYLDEIIKYSDKELLFKTKIWGNDDPHCCPSIPANMLFRRDAKGNWKHVKTIKIKDIKAETNKQSAH